MDKFSMYIVRTYKTVKSNGSFKIILHLKY